MTDNTTLPGTGEIIRDIDKSSKKTQVVVLDLGGAGAESLLTTKLPVTEADGDNAVLGATTGAAVTTDVNGTVQQYLRGLVKLIVAKINIATIDTLTTITNAVGITNALLGGATSDAAVITDATGSIHQYLRGLVKLIAAKINIATVDAVTTITNIVSTKGVGFSIPVTLTVTNGVYSIADVAGGLITFANACSAAGKSAIINTVVLSGVVANPYELWFFAADIATPAADNAVFTLVAADVAMSKGVISIAAGDYNAPASAFNVATLRGVGLQYSCTATSLYAYLKALAVTSPGTTTLTLTIKGEFID